MSETKRLGDIDEVVTMSNDDKFIIIVNGQEWLISKSNLQKVFTGLSSDDYAKINKIVINGNGIKFLNDKGEYVDITTLFNQDQFVKNASGLININGYHTHENQTDVLDKLSVTDEKLLFNGKEISTSSELDAGYVTKFINNMAVYATGSMPNSDGSINTNLDNGGLMKKGGTSSSNFITGIICSGEQFGIQVSNNLNSSGNYYVTNHKVDIIAPWESSKAYKQNYYITYNNKLYQCKTAHTSSDNFDESYWQLIGNSDAVSGTTINNWTASTDYAVNDLVINGTTLYQCKVGHTSGETFDETESANWTALSGEKGDNGYSPVASVEQTDTGCTITIIDASGTTTANLTNGTNGITPHIDETSKHWFIGDVDTGVSADGTVSQAEFDELKALISSVNTSLENTLNGGEANG